MDRYKNYKSSELDHLDQIPSHWSVIPNKRLFTEYFGGSWGNDPDENQTDGLVRVIRLTEFDIDRLSISKDIPTIRALKLNSDSRKLIQMNDIILEKSGGGEKTPVGRAVLIDREFDIPTINSNFTNVCRPNTEVVNPRFLVYSLYSSYIAGQTVKNIKQTTGIQNLDLDGFMSEYFVLPPLHEQQLIARYLDKKTGQIDSLIEKIQKKIELLKEQRTSLINHYVTKGLDPNVEMKDSGVEWIGEIPKHWEVEKLKYVSSVDLSSVDRHEHENEKRVNICHYTDVYKNEYIDSKTALPTGTCSDNEHEKYSLEKGDVLLTKDSESPEDIGIPTLVTEDIDNTVCGYHLAIVRTTSSEFNSEFIYRFIESKNVKDYFFISSSGITRFGLGKGVLENLSILKPPKVEQEQIASKLSSLSLTINQMMERLIGRIDLLQEYRQSLISSAVTGKIRITEDMV